MLLGLANIFSLGLSYSIFIGSLNADDAELWTSTHKMPSSYFKTHTSNHLRCGKLCQRQSKCTAVTFDKRGRNCYMHDAPSESCTKNPNGRYLYKSKHKSAKTTKSTCDEETEIILPSSSNKGGHCYAAIGCPPNAQALGYSYSATVKLCYRIGKGAATWAGAQEICEKENGHLLLVENERVYLWMIKQLSAETSTMSMTYIDGNDEDTPGTFRNNKRERLDWLSWCPDEPNNRNENCLSILIHVYGRCMHGYGDIPCYSSLDHLGTVMYVCQVDV